MFKAAGDPNVLFLRRKAIEAVGELGDLDLLYRARQVQREWAPELDEAFFRATEACLRVAGTSSIGQLERRAGNNGNG